MRQSENSEISSAFTVTRCFPVVGADTDRAEQTVAGMAGIESVKPGRNGKGIAIRYDASRTGYADIEQVLSQAGFAFRRNRWTKIKAAWFSFVDENSRSNAAHNGGACCNHPPGIYGNQRKL